MGGAPGTAGRGGPAGHARSRALGGHRSQDPPKSRRDHPRCRRRPDHPPGAQGPALADGRGGCGGARCGPCPLDRRRVLRGAPRAAAISRRRRPGGTLPALIVRVDLRAGVVQVRSLAAETPPDRSLELWYIDAGAAPQSLGLVPGGTARLPIPAALRASTENATFAVTVEPKGARRMESRPARPSIRAA
ncbi:anti-sigma factor domain-containing protein [Methylobacterium sp. P31]